MRDVVIVESGLATVPDLMRQAVETVPRANLIELLPDGALVGRRTSFALGFETIRFSFRARADGRSEIRAESTNAGVLGFAAVRGAVLDTGRAVLDALERLDGESDR